MTAIVFHGGPRHGGLATVSPPLPYDIEYPTSLITHIRMSAVTHKHTVLGYGELILEDNPLLPPYYEDYRAHLAPDDLAPTFEQFVAGIQAVAHKDPSLEHQLKEQVAIVRTQSTITYRRTVKTAPDGSQVYDYVP